MQIQLQHDVSLSLSRWRSLKFASATTTDPVFKALDIEFMQLRGFTVIKIPASDDLKSLVTFLFIPYGEIPWGKIRVKFSADPVYPSLYIGNDLREHFVPDVYYYPDELGKESENSLRSALSGVLTILQNSDESASSHI